MKLPDLRTLSREDFPDQKDWIEKLIQPINSINQAVTGLLSGNLSVAENVGAQIHSFELTIPDDWIALPLQSPWTHYGAPFAVPAYKKDFFGRVWLKGLLRGGTDANTLLATLPAGYCPAEGMIFSQYHSDVPVKMFVDVNGQISQNSASTFVREINNLGAAVYTAQTPGSFATSWYCLDGISFDAADRSPGPALSCWPYIFKSTLNGKAIAVLANAVDQGQGRPLFSALSVDFDDLGNGTISIRSIPGLSPGRSYKINLLVLPG